MEKETEPKAVAAEKSGGSRKIDTRQLLPAVLIVVSVVWIYLGISEFGFWNPLRGGTPAFMPICIATVLLITSSIMLFKSFKEAKPVYMQLCFVFLVLCVAIIGLSLLIGFLPASLLFVLLWLRVIEKAPWKGTLILSASLAAIAYGVFYIWLSVPFPKGLLFEMIL
jgi:hypothetical protein